MASHYVHINNRFYCSMNIYNDETYVHMRNKYDKNKKLSMKFSDLMDLMRAKDSFEKGYAKLNEESDEGEDSDCVEVQTDEDQAYKQAKEERSPSRTTTTTTKKRKTSDRK